MGLVRAPSLEAFHGMSKFTLTPLDPDDFT